ncbi:MAG: aromatic-ring-hydroxylating dioxygenase subunit beta [Alphaproteobacteria bacterium]
MTQEFRISVPDAFSAEAVKIFAEVNGLLTVEAHLLDDRTYEQWLDLFTEDCLYWMPVDPLAVDGRQRLNVFYDNRARMEDRVDRLTSGSAFSEQPPTLTARTISAVYVTAEQDSTDTDLIVRSNFVLVSNRLGNQQLYGGRCLHHLVRICGSLRIAEKRVTLLGSDTPQRPMTFMF